MGSKSVADAELSPEEQGFVNPEPDELPTITVRPEGSAYKDSDFGGGTETNPANMYKGGFLSN